MIFKLGPSWTQKAKVAREMTGLGVNLVGYRIFDRCSGVVLASSPKSAFKVAVDPNQADCPKPEVKAAPATQQGRQPDPRWPYVLSVGDIRKTMDSIRGQVYACYLQFQIPGAAELEIDVGGMDGNVLTVKLSGKLEDTPTADCITHAVSLARFPSFRAATMKIPYNFYLR